MAFAGYYPSSINAQLLYKDEQFGFQQSSNVLFASKPVSAPLSSVDLYLELFEPTGANVPENRPAVLLIHGGGFTTGSRFAFQLIEACTQLARRGYSCVSIDYRLAGDDPIIAPDFTPIEYIGMISGLAYPTALAAAVEDGWAAYEWIQTNAQSLGIDPERIAIGGKSAGAITALYMAYVLDEIGVAPPNAFKSVFNMWGTLGAIEYSLIDGNNAPIFITHGENDSVIPVASAYAIEAQANYVGLPYAIHIEPSANHGFDIFSATTDSGGTVFETLVDFYFEHVASDSTSIEVPLSPNYWIYFLLFILLLLAFISTPRIITPRN